MYRLLVVLLTTTVAISYGFKLPHVQFLDGRIIGGTDAAITNFPYQISMRVQSWIGSSFSHSCGGSIFNERVIVTAAHCLYGQSESKIRVAVGVSSLKDNVELLTVKRLVVNEQYSSSTIDYDVGLIILTNPLVFSPSVQPIPLANNNPAAGANAVVTGWGSTKEGGAVSNILQEVTVQIVDNAACNKNYGSNSITDQMICAGVEQGGKDACQGDSGGPLVVDGKLVGIVSWGYGCARKDYPGVYSSVANLQSWIIENANQSNYFSLFYIKRVM